jgi:hypothetical protein
MLIKLVAVYALWTRALVLPTYWLARLLNWEEPRFNGLEGPSAFAGYITLPLFTAAFWVVASLVIGGAIGSVVLTLVRSRNPPQTQGAHS